MSERSDNYEIAPPPASSMSESMRGVGYTLETAIADLIDNCITGGAKNVWLNFWWDGPNSFISILDDGQGMEETELSKAMRPGSTNPKKERHPDDLGRFGLGLKTASFSQCRQVSVASIKNGNLAIRRWDLDELTDDIWKLFRDLASGSEERISALLALQTGTMVLWEKLDNVSGVMSTNEKRAHDWFLKAIDKVESHLAMVFHRYLEGSKPDLNIFINGYSDDKKVTPWDPFLFTHIATTKSPVERVSNIEVQGFILPHKDKLDNNTYEVAAGPRGWTSQQGFYVYRRKRMLVSGSWLGLGIGKAWNKEEPYKLARLSLDIPNSLDLDWQIDIKKSTATPPVAVRARLIELANNIRQEARQVFVHRGKYGPRQPVQSIDRAWKVVEHTDSVKYRVNREHPLIKKVLDNAGSLQKDVNEMLKVIEATVPVQRIWLDSFEKDEVQGSPFADVPKEEIEMLIQNLFSHFTGHFGLSASEAREKILKTEPFQNFPNLVSVLTDSPVR